jgi:hypothetical protein
MLAVVPSPPPASYSIPTLTELPKISVIYPTYRKNPEFKWLVDSMYTQCVEENFPPENLQFVVVDSYLWSCTTQPEEQDRRNYIATCINGRFDFTHVAPKPNAYQGPHRLTSKNYFTASNARNTGVCYAKNAYLLFIDDLSVLGEKSFKNIIDCARENVVIGFAYKKVFDLAVEDGSGKITHKREVASGIDSRWAQGNDELPILIFGSQLYGYCGMPLEIILMVNGYDQIHDSMGGEDYNLGIRISKIPFDIYYDRSIVFYEADNSEYHTTVFMRRDPEISKEHYEALMAKYDCTQRYDVNGRCDLSHLLLDMTTRQKYKSEGNTFELAELREHILKGGQFTVDFDASSKTLEGLLISEL